MDFYLVLSIFTFLFLLWIFIHHLARQHIHINISIRKRHLWKRVDEIDSSVFCNICELLLPSSSGFVCEFCEVACDKQECLKIADKQLKCKQHIERKETSKDKFRHLFVRGNLKVNETICSSCNLEITEAHEVGIHGTRCAWCHRSFHDSCAKSNIICDFGELKNFVLPPYALKATFSRLLKEIDTDFKYDDNWQPLIVIANSSSGSNEAKECLTVFRRLLNPIQVFALSHQGPKEALELLKLIPVKCRVVVCGGDGTVAWVLNEMNQMKIEDKASVSILPIGTGNDLARCLEWGPEIDWKDLKNPFEFLRKINKAEPVKLDRWRLKMHYDHIHALPRRLHPDRKMFMYNYCSVGVDALVTLNFHKARASAFYLIKSKIMNKFLYFIYGSKEVFWQKCDGLHKELELYLDDSKIELPELQSIVVLNIDSWGAGVKLIDMIKDVDREFYNGYSYSDGYLEVFAVSSSFHIAQLQVGLTKPIKLGRAKNVKIKIKKVSPMQVDGEPFLQTPCELIITPHSKTNMLKCTK